MSIKKFLLLFMLLVGVGSAESKVLLPSLLSDNALLQRNDNVLLWGKAEPRAEVRVTPSWSGQQYTTKANAKGEWSVEVATGDAGVGYSITFDDGEVTTIENILLGEVWLCSGQSNMEMPVGGFTGQPVRWETNTIAKAKASTPIRYYKVERGVSNTPLDEAQGEWREHTPDVVAEFSATAYFFAEYIQEVLQVPVGIVATFWGGTPIESWMSREMMECAGDFDLSHLDGDANEVNGHRSACRLYNAMMHPLLNYKFKGMLWYQGENNRFKPEEYKILFPAFVEGLRASFNCGDFPFYYAEIAPFKYTGDKQSALMRSAMGELMELVDGCGMISLLDAGEESVIHPSNKRVVGERFAYWALGDAYGIEGIKYRSPQYKEMKVLEASGDLAQRIAIKFINAEGGLCFNVDKSSELFEVAGADGVFYPAQVVIRSSAEYQIEAWSDSVKEPVAVRYAFDDYVKGDVFNDRGLPLPSFRSDDWDVE